MRVIDRLDEYIRYKGINDNQVTVNANLSVGLLNNTRRRTTDLGKKTIEKILNFYQDLDRVWLLTGEGEMIKKADKPIEASHVFQLQTDRTTGAQRIPLYEVTGTCGLTEIFNDASVVPSDYLSVPDLPAVDGAIYVRGDSMSPVIKSGDIIIFKKVELDDTSILWGQIYLLSFAIQGDSYTVVKYVKQSDRPGYIRLISANEFYDPQEIRAESITGMAIVKASITFHTIG